MWHQTYERDEPNAYSTFCESQPGVLWIMGGGGGGYFLDSTYLLSQPEGMRQGPNMPQPMDDACAVAINDTHTFMAGMPMSSLHTISNFVFLCL